MDKSIEAAAKAILDWERSDEAFSMAREDYFDYDAVVAKELARAAIAAYRDAEIERLTQGDESWPSPRYAQEIVFEGCARLAIAPEEYEALYNAHADLRAKLEAAERDAALLPCAVKLLADWCVSVDEFGSGWDYWDDHYKDAMYRPGPLRELLDAAIKAARGGERG